jgi:hypothetical protein
VSRGSVADAGISEALRDGPLTRAVPKESGHDRNETAIVPALEPLSLRLLLHEGDLSDVGAERLEVIHLDERV